MAFQTLIIYAVLVTQYVCCQEVNVLSGFDTNTDDVYEGMNITLSCRVTQEFNSPFDSLLIFKTNPFIPLASQNGLVHAGPANIEFLGFLNENELRLNILDIQLSDSGTYSCTATQNVDGQSRGIGRGFLDINVKNSNPPEGKPKCFILSDHLNLILRKGETLMMSCSSDVGEPPQIALQWNSSSFITLPEAVTFKSNVETEILSSLNSEADSSFDGIEFTCSRHSNLFPSSDDSCSLGPFIFQEITHVTTETTNTTLIPGENNNQTAIVASTITVIIILILLSIVIIIILIKLGKCPLYISQNSNKTKPKPAENVPIEMVSVNDSRYMENGGLDNPIPVEHFVANGGAEYALISKKTAPQGSEDTNKYPNPPNYPRPPKAMDEEDGEQYANSSVVTSPRGLRNKDNAKEHSKEDPTYGNTSDVAINVRQSSPPELQDQNGGPLYVNSSDVTLSRKSVPSEILNDADEKQTYANSPTPVDGERLPPNYEQDEHSEEPLYADASAAKNRMPQLAVAKTDSFHHPAPDISPPPPPQEETESHGDVGLAYADLDLGDGPLTISDGVSKPTNRDSVVYASIA